MKNIPIVILNFNRLTTTKKLYEQLIQLDYKNIYIFDLGSTYQPLLTWYKSCPYEIIKVENIGHKGFWEQSHIQQFRNWEYIVVTDSDIELNVHTPAGFIEQMISVANDYHVNKVGLAIKYRDISNPIYKKVITPIEEKYWRNKITDLNGLVEGKSRELYSAPVDTSFCIVKPNLSFQYDAIRIAGDFTCKHTPWYSDWDNLFEEEQYYMNNANPNIATCVQWYNQWKTQNNI